MQQNKTLRGVAIFLAVVAAAAILGTAAFFITTMLYKSKDDPATTISPDAVAADAAAQDGSQTTLSRDEETTAAQTAGDSAGTDVFAADTAGSDTAAGPTVSADAIAAIFMDHRDVWLPDYSSNQLNGVCFGFLDLDFDGIPELIVNIYGGSGRYSYNYYYKADPADKTVTEIDEAEDYKAQGFDLFSLTENAPKLLQNKETGERFYYCTDYVRVSTGDYGLSFGTMRYAGGKVWDDILFSEQKTEAGRYDNEEEISVYALYINGNYTETDEATYTRKKDDFFAQHENMHLQFGTVTMSDFHDADRATQTALLADACSAFRYDGSAIQ